VELSLVLPVILTIIMGVGDLSRAFYFSEAVAGSVRQALRAGVAPVDDPAKIAGTAACQGTGPAATAMTYTAHLPWAGGDPAFMKDLADRVDQEASSRLNGATMTVTWHCKSGKQIVAANADSTDPSVVGSDSINVRISYNFALVTPMAAQLLGGPTIPVVNQQFARVEYQYP
jgi:hypothetical protein